MRSVLQERQFPVDAVRFFASSRSAGRLLSFRGSEIPVEDAATADFAGVDIALFSSGATASRALASQVAAAGAVVIDNSSAWRMDPDVPLVVPEVNGATLGSIPKGIVANPNCTTMVAMPVLKPLHDAAGLRRLVVSTYQAVSGAGLSGVSELSEQLAKSADHAAELTFDGAAVEFPPPVDLPGDHRPQRRPRGRTAGRRRLGRVRRGTEVPQREQEDPRYRRSGCDHHLRAGAGVHGALARHHGGIRLGAHPGAGDGTARGAPGVELSDMPMPLRAAGTDPSLVGRIRRDPGAPNGLALFVCGDNLRKGAALNAVQIAESLLALGLVS